MKFTEEYLATAEKDIRDLIKMYKGYWEGPRYHILLKFCKNCRNILSVGCGPKEPILINAAYACDITPLSCEALEKSGWKGIFFISSCDKIKAFDKEFDIAVCSEVIEHLPTTQDVINTFKEVDRVAKKWIITTPNSAVIPPPSQNLAHKLFFTLEIIKKIIPFVEGKDYKIYTHDYHMYIESI